MPHNRTRQPLPVDLGCETGAEICEDVIQSIVSTSGTAAVKVDPDKFTVTVGIETNGTTAEEAASLNAEMAAKIIAALKAFGISEDDISTSSYSRFTNICKRMQSDGRIP